MTRLISPDKYRIRTPGMLRFVDASNLADVNGGLEVSLIDPANPAVDHALLPVRGGRWIARKLPGVPEMLPPLALRTLADREPVDAATTGAFPARWTGTDRTYEIRVSDRQNRFLPARFSYSMPDPAQSMWDVWGSPPEPRIRCLLKPGQAEADYIPLFNRSGRVYDVPVARVAAHLAIRGDDGRDRPASWALLRVRSGNPTVGLGMADENGNVEVAFPYPDLPALSAAEASDGRSRIDWSIRISVHFGGLSGGTSEAGDTLPPDFGALLGQLNGPATTALKRLGQPQAIDNPELVLGERLVLRTEDGPNSHHSSLYLEAS